VRSRSPLFRQIIAALKAHGLPIAGVDRSALTAPLAVQDLLSLLRFLATPEDDLSLAEVLRSPIGGWGDDDLFRLAHGRVGFLWEALRQRAGAPGLGRDPRHAARPARPVGFQATL
jgi:ATP-dependent helicase/nuclease subunit A